MLNRRFESQGRAVIQFLRWICGFRCEQCFFMAKHFECREHWRAVDTARNIARDYQLTVTLDLFGWTVVERHRSRVGCKGKGARDSFSNAASARRFFDAVRLRRGSARHRIGVAYRSVEKA